MKKLKDPRMMLTVAMAVFGTLGPFVRNIAVSSGELALYRAVLAAMLIGGFLFITKQFKTFTLILSQSATFATVYFLISYYNRYTPILTDEGAFLL